MIIIKINNRKILKFWFYIDLLLIKILIINMKIIIHNGYSSSNNITKY